MELQDTFNSQIDEIQKKLREANYQCNQLRKLIADSLSVKPGEKPQAQVQSEPVVPVVETIKSAPAQPADRPRTVPPPIPAQVLKEVPPSKRELRKAARKQKRSEGSAVKRDWEKFIGENLINKIGIAILVIGVGIFVKFAIDRNWIGEIGRVAIGVGVGGLLLGVAHWLREKYKAFSSVLIGGGLATLYFTIAIAFQEYAIFSQTVAFAIMIVITGFAIALSLAYDRKEIAILALLGGFGAPFMVTTGDGNVVILFSYLMILNVGITVMAWFKNWRILNLLGYVGTLVIYLGWLGANLTFDQEIPTGAGMLFAGLFFGLFFVMFVLNQVRSGEKLKALDYVLLLSNSAIFYGAGMVLMENADLQLYQGLLTAGMGLFHFAFILPLRNREKTDPNLIILLIGLVMSFITLAVPIQLEGSYITLFWAAEAVLLLWLGQRTGIKLMKLSSILVTLGMLISLGWDWVNLYYIGDASLMLIINKAFITGVVSLASLLMVNWLLKKEGEESSIGGMESRFLSQLYFYLGIIVMYLVGMLEFTYQVGDFIQNGALVGIAFGTYNALFLSGLMLYARWKEIGFITSVTLIASAAMVVAYGVIHRGQIIDLRQDVVFQAGGQGPFLFHYVFIALMLVMISLDLYHIREKYSFSSVLGKISIWVSSAVVIFMASSELDHLVVLSGYEVGANVNHLLETARKVGYPILWGVCGFIMIFLGMRFKNLHLRIAALSLFLITLIKLFVYDIQDVPPAGKIAAFVSLGVLLLIISFMYQRLKRLLVDEEKRQATEAAAEANVPPATPPVHPTETEENE